MALDANKLAHTLSVVTAAIDARAAVKGHRAVVREEPGITFVRDDPEYSLSLMIDPTSSLSNYFCIIPYRHADQLYFAALMLIDNNYHAVCIEKHADVIGFSVDLHCEMHYVPPVTTETETVASLAMCVNHVYDYILDVRHPTQVEQLSSFWKFVIMHIAATSDVLF